MPVLETSDEGVVLPVKAKAAARSNAIRGMHDGVLRVDVTTAPEKGKANKAIQALLARHFCLPRSSVVLIAGATNPHKRFLLCGISAEAVERMAS